MPAGPAVRFRGDVSVVGALESFKLRIRELAGWVDCQPWVQVLMGHLRKLRLRESW